MNILYTFSKGYALPAGVSLTSLLENSHNAKEVTAYLVALDIAEEDRKRFCKLEKKYGCRIVWMDGQPVVDHIRSLGVAAYRNAYIPSARLFWDRYIKDDLKTLWYVDCDTIFCEATREITPDKERQLLGEQPLAMVCDSLAEKYKRLVGFSNKTYYNAGVILFDCQKWRDYGCCDKLVSFCMQYGANFCNTDQDIINSVMDGFVKRLPPEYNFQPVHRAFSDKAYKFSYKDSDYYTIQKISYARERPIILHTFRFLGQVPWSEKNIHPDKDIYEYYLKLSPWKDMPKQKDKDKLGFRIERLLFQILPRTLFLKIFCEVQYGAFIYQAKKLKRKNRKNRGGINCH